MLANIQTANKIGKKAAEEELARRRRAGGAAGGKLKRPDRMPKSGQSVGSRSFGSSSSHHRSSHHRRGGAKLRSTNATAATTTSSDDLSDVSSVTSFGTSLHGGDTVVSRHDSPPPLREVSSSAASVTSSSRSKHPSIAMEDDAATKQRVAEILAAPPVTLHFDTIDRVLASWDAAQRQHGTDFAQLFGTLLARSLFTEAKSSMALFGLPSTTDVNDTTTLHSKRFQLHAGFLVTMIDGALNLLGPDEDLLLELLLELGRKHARAGVEPRLLPIFQRAVLNALKVVLVDNTNNNEDATENGSVVDDAASARTSGSGSKLYSEQTEQAWKQTLEKICNDMIRGMVAAG